MLHSIEGATTANLGVETVASPMSACFARNLAVGSGGVPKRISVPESVHERSHKDLAQVHTGVSSRQ